MALNPGIANVISSWSMDEESGVRADSHGANDLADNNTVLFAAGKIGNAANFERDNSEYLSIADNVSLSVTGALTICGWIKIESGGTVRRIITKSNTTGDQRSYAFQISTGDDLTFTVSSDGTAGAQTTATATTFGSLSTGVWYFIVAQHDPVANTIGVSVNAGTIDTAAHSTNIFDSTADFIIGTFQTLAGFYDGLVDEVVLFSEVLSQDEIDWLYNAGNGRSYDELKFVPSVIIY